MKIKLFQMGLSLIEIMIASLIGVFLLGGVLQIFISTKQTYRMQEGLSRLQENGRYAIELLSNNIRMAGFLGCNSGAPLTNVLNSSTDFLYDLGKSLEGFESTGASAWTPAKNATITEPLGGSDIITIRRANDQSFFVLENTAGNTDLKLDATATETNLQAAGYLNNESTPANHCAIAVVSDCTSAAVFQVSAITGYILSHTTGGACSPGNLSGDLGRPYMGGQVYPINTISYYVRNNPGNQPSLYRRVGLNDAEELVEGIENMQILYGVDTDTPFNGPNYYSTANNITNTDWSKVVSVRISLLAVSIDNNLAAQPHPYSYNGTTTTPTDRKIRRVFNTTIALRNRLP
jgi:type IV pilus assembly protein PilW